MRDEVRWERMFPDELERAFRERPVVYFTHGLCEPHGPQNAIGLDGLKARAIAIRAARAHGGIVAPADWWHVHELGGYALWAARNVGEVERKWLTAVPPWVHFKNVCYQIRAAEVIGFRAAILLTGHYGPNWEDLKTLVRLIQPHVRVRLHGLPDFEANTSGYDDDGASGDHAGKVETSLLWALAPECTDLSRIPDPAGDPAAATPCFAMGSTARESSRKVGERMVADEVRWLGSKVEELLSAYDGTAAVPGLPTFESVERFWETEVGPRIKTFRSMQQGWTAGETVAADSVWHENWRVPDRS